MRVKDHIREGLDELRAAGRINEYVHALLLTRTNSLIAGDCGDFYQTVRNELLRRENALPQERQSLPRVIRSTGV